MGQGWASFCQTPLTDSRISARFANCNSSFPDGGRTGEGAFLGICASLLDPEAKHSFIQETVFIGYNCTPVQATPSDIKAAAESLQNRYL